MEHLKAEDLSLSHEICERCPEYISGTKNCICGKWAWGCRISPHMNMMKVSYVWLNEAPPRGCPYELEHMITNR